MATNYKQDRERLSRRFRGQGFKDEQEGNRVTDEATRRFEDFDANEGAKESARAQFDTFREDFAEDLGDLRGSQVGRGRVGGGFGSEEEDELFRDSSRRLMRSLSENAMRAQGLNLQANAGLSRIGEGRTNRYLDILGSERDANMAEDELQRLDEARRKGGLFGALGSIAGTVLGGPVGTAIGNKLGGFIENL